MVREPTQQAGSSCCLEADAHDYLGDYAINLDGSVVLKSGVIPYRIEPYKVLACPNPTGTQFGGTSIMATGASRRSASRRAWKVEMRLNDPSVYLRMRGHTGAAVIECAAC